MKILYIVWVKYNNTNSKLCSLIKFICAIDLSVMARDLASFIYFVDSFWIHKIVNRLKKNFNLLESLDTCWKEKHEKPSQKVRSNYIFNKVNVYYLLQFIFDLNKDALS